MLSINTSQDLQTSRHSHKRILSSTLLGSVIFGLDVVMPLGVAAGVPYVVFVCLGVWYPKRDHVFILAAIATLLTIIGYYLSPSTEYLWKAILNLVAAVLVIWITAGLIFYLKTAISKTQEDEKRFRDYTHTATDWMWEQDKDLRLTSITQKYDQEYGTYVNKDIGLTRWEIAGVDPNLDEKWRAHVKDLEERRAFQNFEYEYETPEHDVKYRMVSGVPVYDIDGNFTGYRGTTVDTSARKLSEEKFRAAFEHVAVGNILIDEVGNIESINTAAQKIFGYDSNEAIGQNIKLFMPEPDSSAHDTYLQNYRDSSNAKIIGIGREVTGRRQNGEEFPMHLSIGEFSLGRSKSFIGSVIDLTEKADLEKQLRQLQRMEAIGQLTGGIAHDFNNLLAVMLGNAELLDRYSAANETSQRYLDSIIGAINRASSLTDRLLSYSRQQVLTPATSDVTRLIEELVELLNRTLGENYKLNIIKTHKNLYALLDSHQFENALINLVLNARDAMPVSGTVSIEITSSYLDEAYTAQHPDLNPGEYVKISVSDTGTGMPPQVLDKVFEPFFTTKEFGKGSGLGLSMVFGFTKQSGGHVTIESSEGHGSKVDMYLPRADGDNTTEDQEQNRSPVLSGTERILVLEDDHDVREIVVNTLRNEGYDVVEAAHGRDAINLLSDGSHYNLLFTDVVLPGGISGFDAAAKAKLMHPDIKVIYATGYADTSMSQTEPSEPDTISLNKPFRQSELLIKIRQVLDSNIANAGD